MAREKKSDSSEGGLPAWLITFSDLMTLLLTFFVLLMSMAVIDERAKRDVIGSVAKEMGFGTTITNTTAPSGKKNLLEPGKMDLPDEDLQPLKDRIFDDSSQDLKFQENKFVQIFSLSDEVLFLPGSTDLSPSGMVLLNRLLPYLHRLEYPLLVAGHAGLPRDEEGGDYLVNFDKTKVDVTWLISFRRAMAVYRHLVAEGIPPDRLSLEAFGHHRARFNNNTPEGRKQNRRVDLVLDKRNRTIIEQMEKTKKSSEKKTTEYEFQGFQFDLQMPQGK